MVVDVIRKDEDGNGSEAKGNVFCSTHQCSLEDYAEANGSLEASLINASELVLYEPTTIAKNKTNLLLFFACPPVQRVVIRSRFSRPSLISPFFFRPKLTVSSIQFCTKFLIPDALPAANPLPVYLGLGPVGGRP